MRTPRKHFEDADIRIARLQSLLGMALLICVLALGIRLVNRSGRPAPFEECVLDYVVDGDTINVHVGGVSTRIRLIGIDTPESVSRTVENTPQGKAASEYLQSLIRRGDTLYLEYDEQKYDDYGRTLAYVWLSPDADAESYDDFCRRNLNAVIYQNTYCELLTIPPNDKYYNWFMDLTPWQNKV